MLLTRQERDWLDAYHARVLAIVGPLLRGRRRGWLEAEVRADRLMWSLGGAADGGLSEGPPPP